MCFYINHCALFYLPKNGVNKSEKEWIYNFVAIGGQFGLNKVIHILIIGLGILKVSFLLLF